MKKQPYIQQTHGTTCVLIAALNARIFYSKPVENAREDQPEFMRLAIKYHCIHGPCLNLDALFNELGFDIEHIVGPTQEALAHHVRNGKCIAITLTTPEVNLHCGLITNCVQEDWGYLFEVVNSQRHGPCTIEWLTWDDLCAEPGLVQRNLFEHHTTVLSLKNCARI